MTKIDRVLSILKKHPRKWHFEQGGYIRSAGLCPLEAAGGMLVGDMKKFRGQVSAAGRDLGLTSEEISDVIDAADFSCRSLQDLFGPKRTARAKVALRRRLLTALHLKETTR